METNEISRETTDYHLNLKKLLETWSTTIHQNTHCLKASNTLKHKNWRVWWLNERSIEPLFPSPLIKSLKHIGRNKIRALNKLLDDIYDIISRLFNLTPVYSFTGMINFNTELRSIPDFQKILKMENIVIFF